MKNTKRKIFGKNGYVLDLDTVSNKNDAFFKAIDAITNECVEALEILTEKYPEILEMVIADDRETLLHCAAWNVKAFCFLAPRMPEALEKRNRDGQVPAHLAIYGVRSCGSIDALKMIEQMAPETFEMTDIYGRTPAHIASEELLSIAKNSEDFDKDSMYVRWAFDYLCCTHEKTMDKRNIKGETPLYHFKKACGVAVEKDEEKRDRERQS